MSLTIPSHLYRNRHGTFYFRLCVPRDLQSLVGRSEVRLSMDTEQRREAMIHAFPLVFDLPNLWAGLRNMPAKEEPIPTDYFKLWRLQQLENAKLKMSIVQLKEQLEEQQEQIWRMVPKNNAELVVKQAYTKGQLKGMTAVEERLEFPWSPDRTVSFSALMAAYMAHFEFRAEGGRKKPPGAKTLEGYRKDLELFISVMGDMNIGAIDRELAGRYFTVLKKLPPNISRVAAYRGKSIDQILAIKPPPEPQSEYNASKKMERASGLFKWALEEKRKWGIDSNPFFGFGQSGDSAKKRRPFTSEELRRLFTTATFVSRKFSMSYAYWLMPLAIYTGARLGELCQLDLKDFVEVEGIPCIDINDIEAPDLVAPVGNRKKRVKTKNARRLVPIHGELIRIGLLSYVAEMRARDEVYLFPELSRSRRDGPAHAASNWFQRYRKAAGLDEKQVAVFHSFRHLFITTLLDTDVSPHQVAPIVGHEADLITGQVYWDKRDATKRKPTVDAFELPADIAALLPSVTEITFSPRRKGRKPKAPKTPG